MLKKACIVFIIFFLVICASPFLVTEGAHGQTNVSAVTVIEEGAAVAQAPLQVENQFSIPIAKTEKTWALVNFACMITTVVVSLILTILGWYNRWTRRKIVLDKAHQESYQFWLRILAIISILIFILTENILLSMVIVDRFTPVMVALTISAIGTALFSKYSIKEFYPYNKL